MIPWIVERTLRLRAVVGVVAAVVLVGGVVQLRNAKVDNLPEFGPPTVEVHTEALGLSAPEVEQLITVPLEQDLLDGVAWLAAIHSESMPGLSSIELIFEPGTNLLRARQLVQERLSQAAGLPNVAGPPLMLLPESSTSRVMMIGFTSKTVSAIRMSVLARWTIRPKLLSVRGVANVAVFGFRDRQLQVQVDPRTLQERGIPLDKIVETTGNALWASPLTFLEANTPGTGGFIDTGNQRLSIQHLQPITTAKDLAQVPIEELPDVRLGDVARVVEDHQPLIGDALLKGGEGLLIVVEKAPGANTLDVTRGVQEALDDLRPGLKGIQIDPTVYRPASFIEQSVHNVGIALIVGLVALILALGLFYFDWRRLLVAIVGTVLSLLVAAFVLSALGTTINTMVFAGLFMAIVVVISDAVGDAENMARHVQKLGADADGESVMRSIVRAALEMRSALVYATLISLVAIVPLFSLRGTAGAFFTPVAESYALAVAASMVVALIVTPVLGLALFSNGPREGSESPIARRLAQAYERMLSRTVTAPRMASGAVAALVLIGLVVVPFLDHSLLPSFKDSDVLVDWQAAPGTSLPEMDRITARASRDLEAIPGVDNVGVHLGRAITSDQVVNVDSGQLWMNIDPGADYDATIARIREVIGKYPRMRGRILSYPEEQLSGLRDEPTNPIVVRVFGEDLSVLRAKGEEMSRRLSRIKGVVHPRVEKVIEEPTVDVEVDLDAAKSHGIKPGDVRRAAATMFSGLTVGSLYEEQKIFDVVVWSVPEARNSLDSIRNLLIDTPGGGRVRLGDVAHVRVTSTPAVIRHREISRTLDITADVRGRRVGAVVRDVSHQLRNIKFPLEYHAELVGDYAQRQAARNGLIAVAVAAAVAAFLLLQAAFGSWRLATAFFLAVPMAIAGGFVAPAFGGRLLSIGSVAGLLAVLAFAVRNGIVLVRHCQQLERDTGSPFGADLVVRGSRERLASISTAAAATAFALLPMVVWNAPGLQVVHPMAVAILGGLVTSVVFTLFVLPALYLRYGGRRAQEATTSPFVTLPEADVVRGG
jgi:Cu/Ag efflux pump CusA